MAVCEGLQSSSSRLQTGLSSPRLATFLHVLRAIKSEVQ